MKWLYLLLLNGCFLVSAQEQLTVNAVQDSILNQLALFPHEKIHLHTDRSMYVPGEKIWFKAYIVDAYTHQGPTYSQYVYVELINSFDSLMYRAMVSSDDNGLFHGHLFLEDLIPAGDYTLRAYTRYMENLGDDYFFKKNIRIDNLKETAEQKGRQAVANYDVSFFPEGGNMAVGVQNRVAFKALNQSGASEFITGELVDQAGNALCEVTTVYAGMGSFLFIPEAGNEYFLLCRSNSGQEKRFKLPPARPTCTIATTYRNQRHYVQVKRSPDQPEQPLYLLVHCKGEVFYFALWDYQSEYITLSSEWLPSGVLQAVLFDELMNPISERLIFNKNEDQANLVFSSDKPVYQKREKISSEIYLTDIEGYPLSGHVSVSVTDDMDMAVDAVNTITASLLLSSELRGYIESPGYYLQDNREAEHALDHLMMTHGWRRYEISEAIKGNYKRPETEYEVSKEISGLVKGGVGGPAKDAQVTFFSGNGDIGTVTTDSKGLFRVFLHYPDSIKYYVQAKDRNGKNFIELVLNQEEYPALNHAPFSWPSSLADMENFIKKAGQRVLYDDDMRYIQLSTVTVTATRIDKKDKARLENWATYGSSKTIYREDIERVHFSTFNYYLQSHNIRLFSLILIDGIERDISIDDIDINEVECIDYFKINNPALAMFGFRGSGGVLSITTRRGDPDGSSRSFYPNLPTFISLGYQTPVDFYAPKYDMPESSIFSVPDNRTTLYWKPDVIVGDDGKASFDFYTSDATTTYSVVIEGISNDGKIIRQVETIEVQ